jgi:hypothetical protein
MLGKYKTATLLAVFALVCAAGATAAPSYINKLGLDRDGSFTVLTIHGSDQLRIAHQSIEAKQGKPFRIVIDCLASRHSLQQKEFADIPQSIIKSIRTSQYSVTPEEVVRIVLDLNEESVYRVESAGNAVKVLVADQKTASFSKWTSQHVEKPVAVVGTPVVKAEKKQVVKRSTANKPEDQKQVAKVSTGKQKPVTPSATPKPSVVARKEVKTTPKTQKPPVTASVETKPETTKPQSVFASAPLAPKLKPAARQAQTTPKAKPANVEKTEPQQPEPAKVSVKTDPVQPAKTRKPAPKKDLAKDTIKKAAVYASLGNTQNNIPEPGATTDATGSKNEDVHKKAPAKSESADKNKPESKPLAKKAAPVKSEVSKPKKSESKPAAKKAAPTVPAPVKQDKDVVLASVDKEAPKPDVPSTSKVDKIKTSKYRRETAKSAEMKSSQVVQFPQRMVIKYRRPNPRDPFESLIVTEGKKKGNVDLSRVPNVERLNLVGILEPVVGKDAALMEDLDGIGYILRTGDRVKNGYVAQIDENAIYFQINEYGWGRTIVKHMEKNN